jgi:hypothetical protein
MIGNTAYISYFRQRLAMSVAAKQITSCPTIKGTFLFIRSFVFLVLVGSICGACSGSASREVHGQPPSAIGSGAIEDHPNYFYRGKPFNIVHIGTNNLRAKALRDEALARAGIETVDLMAATSGTLKISQGCLVLGSRGSSNGRIIAFPGGGYSWDNQTSTLSYRGKNYKIGDEVTFGGGESPIGDPNAEWPDKLDLFAYNCEVPKNIFVVN